MIQHQGPLCQSQRLQVFVRNQNASAVLLNHDSPQTRFNLDFRCLVQG
jgi:hypothetical protein